MRSYFYTYVQFVHLIAILYISVFSEICCVIIRLGDERSIYQSIKGKKGEKIMREKMTMKRAILFLAVVSVMIFGMSITASAAVTDVKQTAGTSGSVTVTWNKGDGEYYYKLYYSTSENGEYVSGTKSDFYNYTNTGSIANLKAGTIYYVKVASYKKNDDKLYEMSAPIQVVTAPESVKSSSFMQTAGNTSSITVTWAKSAGTTGYIVTKRIGQSNKGSKVVSTNKTTLSTSTGKMYTVAVVAYKKAPKTGFVAKSDESQGVGMKSSPSTPLSFAINAKNKPNYYSWTNTNLNPYPILYWDNNSKDDFQPDGYHIEIYTVDGKKKIKTFRATSRSITINSVSCYKLIKNKGFKTRIRAFVKNGSAVCFSKWSTMRTIIPQAAITITSATSNSVKIKWPKVANAVKYKVYVSRDSGFTDSGHWGMKEVSASATSYTIKGLKKGQEYAVYVIPVVKINGKYYSATRTWYTYSSVLSY